MRVHEEPIVGMMRMHEDFEKSVQSEPQSHLNEVVGWNQSVKVVTGR